MQRATALVLVLLFGITIDAYSAVHIVGPSDCSVNAVNSAIFAAQDGDTVRLTCTGTVQWASTVSIPNTKGITLEVSGGSNTPKSSGIFPLTISSSANPIMYVNCENNNSATRVTGFKFTNTVASTFGAIYVKGRGVGKTGIGAYRIDNNYFADIQLPNADLYGTVTLDSSTGVLTGVVDNNTFRDCSYTDGYTISVIELWKYGGNSYAYSGGNAWTRPFSFGSADFHFLEDNLIENVARYTRHMVMGSTGAKYVVRYNTFDIGKNNSGTRAQVIDAHGLCICSSTGQGTRGGELYGNIFKGGEIFNSIYLRGGTWLVYDNEFLSEANSEYGHMQLREYRAAYCSQCSNACSSITPWNNCVTDLPTLYPLKQQIIETYFWNNIYSGSNVSPMVDEEGYQRLYIQAGRDYFVSEKKPTALLDYTPFPYPHPLRDGLSIIQTPKNLRISN